MTARAWTLSLAALAGLGLAGLVQATGPSSAQEHEGGAMPAPDSRGGFRCDPGQDLRCWYMVHAVGEAPRRLALIASNIGPLQAGRRKVEFVQAIEQADYKHRYVIWQLDVDCSAGRFRVERDRVGHPNGTVTDAPVENGDWQAVSEGRFGENAVVPLACSQGQPGPDTAIYLGNAYRAPDMVQHFRSVFWGGGISRAGR